MRTGSENHPASNHTHDHDTAVDTGAVDTTDNAGREVDRWA